MHKITSHSYVIEEGKPAYVLVPVDEYEQLIKASMVDSAVAKLGDENVNWVDADELKPCHFRQKARGS